MKIVPLALVFELMTTNTTTVVAVAITMAIIAVIVVAKHSHGRLRSYRQPLHILPLLPYLLSERVIYFPLLLGGIVLSEPTVTPRLTLISRILLRIFPLPLTLLPLPLPMQTTTPTTTTTTTSPKRPK